jgi:hypothetical protein
MGTPNPALGKLPATAVESRGIELEIPPAEVNKGRSTKMPQNGSESRAGQQAKSGKVRAKAKGRRGVTAIGREDLCATTGARGMDTVATLQPATFPMMVLKEELKGKGMGQHHYRPKP